MSGPAQLYLHLTAAAGGALGLLMLLRGWRGRLLLAAPSCGACHYDLRAADLSVAAPCPECGRSVSRETASYARWAPIRWLMAAGGLLLLLSLTGDVTGSFLLNDPRLRQIWFGELHEDPRWMELAGAMRGGTAGGGEVNRAISRLACQYPWDKPGPAPLNYSNINDFFAAAFTYGQADPDRLRSLMASAFAEWPNVRLRRTIRENEPLRILVESRTMCANLQQRVRLLTSSEQPVGRDGKTQIAASMLGGGVAVQVEHSLPPGEHELRLEGEIFGGRGGSGFVWKCGRTLRVRVVAAQQPVITLVTDPLREPPRPTIRRLYTRPDPDGVHVVADFVDGGEGLCHRAYIRSGTSAWPSSSCVIKTGSGMYYPGKAIALPPTALPANLDVVDVVLRPDVELAERQMGVEEIWGGEIVIPNVPLQRFDLPPSASRAPAHGEAR